MNEESDLNIAGVVPLSVLASAVLLRWAPHAARAVVAKKRTGEQWLVIGVTVSFSAILVNSLYWGVHYFFLEVGNAERAHNMYLRGSLVQLLTWVIPGCIAAGAHLFSWDRYAGKVRYSVITFWIALLGFAAAYAALQFFTPRS